jgi:hypothetical protein
MTAQPTDVRAWLQTTLDRFASLRADAILAAGPPLPPESYRSRMARYGTPIQTFEEACRERERRRA